MFEYWASFSEAWMVPARVYRLHFHRRITLAQARRSGGALSANPLLTGERATLWRWSVAAQPYAAGTAGRSCPMNRDLLPQPCRSGFSLTGARRIGRRADAGAAADQGPSHARVWDRIIRRRPSEGDAGFVLTAANRAQARVHLRAAARACLVGHRRNMAVSHCAPQRRAAILKCGASELRASATPGSTSQSTCERSAGRRRTFSLLRACQFRLIERAARPSGNPVSQAARVVPSLR